MIVFDLRYSPTGPCLQIVFERQLSNPNPNPSLTLETHDHTKAGIIGFDLWYSSHRLRVYEQLLSSTRSPRRSLGYTPATAGVAILKDARRQCFYPLTDAVTANAFTDSLDGKNRRHGARTDSNSTVLLMCLPLFRRRSLHQPVLHREGLLQNLLHRAWYYLPLLFI